MRSRSPRTSRLAPLFALLLPASALLAAQPPLRIEVVGGDDSGKGLEATEKLGQSPVAPLLEAPLGQGVVGEVEPNNTSATATPLPGNDVVVRASIFPNGDLDYFSFAASAGDRVYAATQTSQSANGSTDSQLELFGTDGTTSIEFDDDNGTFGSLSSSIAGATIPANGTYFLRVKHFSATNQLRPYDLHFKLQSGAPVAETEPNDTLPGQALPASGWVSGSLSATTDVDLYSIALNAGDTVFLSLDLDPERDSVEWNGQLGLGTFNNFFLTANDGGGTGPDSEAYFMTVKDAGNYAILVNVPTGGTTFGTYQLSVAVLPATNEGLNCTTYTSTDVPQTIPTGPGLVSSTITVPGNPRIADLDVSIELNHTFMPDLDVHLRSPAGNDNGLFTDIGSSTQTPMNLTLDDEAGIPIGLYTVVSGMTYQPELAYRLAWFDGEDAGGTWTLDLRDDAAGNGGTLTGWSIRVCEPAPPPACPPGFAPVTVFTTDFEAGAAGFTHGGAADEWELGLPTFAPLTTCASGGNCWVTDLDNTYDPNSNQNLLSPSIDLTGFVAPVVVRWAQRYQMESASFDHYSVDVRQAGGSNPTRLFEWQDATMTDGVGSPSTVLAESAGWGVFERRADAYAGLDTELSFHLDSDNSVQFAGVAIDDVSVTACEAAPCTLTCPDDITVANDLNQCGAAVTFAAPTPSGSCGPIVCTPLSGSFFDVGTTLVSCAEELNAPSGVPGPGACSFNVTVNDTQAPVFTPPANPTAGTEAPACEATVDYVVGLSDNCQIVGASCSWLPTDPFPLGVTNVTCQAVDEAGNIGSTGFTVTVIDDDPPTATAPDATIGTDAGVCSAVFDYTPGYADNCPGGSTVCSPPSGSTFPLGANTVTCTATDGAGNTSGDSGTVTVFDDEPPVLVCPADLFQGVPPGTASWPVSYVVPTPTDNCPGVTGDCAPPSGDPFPLGTTTVACTATDGAALTASCDFDVTVAEQSIQEIPTLSGAGLVALALLLAGFAAVALRRRRA
ncbi:MAG: IPTL-CTERM sorting domain-containing protein [Acidobacteria bacterium]|nr:IPTL-CTERM sorting domain-containing protein [Acidobacteriota bacterium]